LTEVLVIPGLQAPGALSGRFMPPCLVHAALEAQVEDQYSAQVTGKADGILEAFLDGYLQAKDRATQSYSPNGNRVAASSAGAS